MSNKISNSENNNSENLISKKKKPPKLVVGLIFVGLALIATFFWPGSVSRQQAHEIAIAHVGGGVANTPEFDFESFRRVWNVEVFHDGLVHSVYVSRFTGEIVRVEIDVFD